MPVWLIRSLNMAFREFVLLPSEMQAVGWLVGRWFVFSRIFPSDHDGAALPLPPSLFLPSFLTLDGWGRQGMMRWNGIGRATDGRTSSCTSLASSSSNSKEKETGDDGDGERKKEEEEKQKERERGIGWRRNDPQVFLDADRGSSFVRSLVVGNTNSIEMAAAAAEGGQWNGGSLSNSVIEVAALFQQSAAVGCVVCLNVRDDDTNSTFSFSLIIT